MPRVSRGARQRLCSVWKAYRLVGLTLASASLWMLVSCRRPPADTTSLDGCAQAYVRLALALGERDADSLDFATVPAESKAEARRGYLTLATIRTEAGNLAQRLRQAAVRSSRRDRAAFLSAQIAALDARAEMLQRHRLPFDEEARALFATERLPDTHAEERSRLRQQIAMLLPTASPGIGEAQRYAEYLKRFVVPTAKLLPVMEAALGLCRARTVAHIALPARESVDVQLVRNKPWAAFSHYLGHAHSEIQLNTDMPITADDALEFACHEGYPGHHVFNTLRDLSLVQQQGFAEAEVQLTFSPQSYVSEAAAAYAPALAYSPGARTRALHDVLAPLAGLAPKEMARLVAITTLARQLDTAEPAIAQQYLDGRLEFVRAEQALAHEALMASSEDMLLYLNEYRSYMLAYTDGPRRLAAELDVLPAGEARWKAYERVMRTERFALRSPGEPAREGTHP